MGTLGIIPTIENDDQPLSIPLEMLPVGIVVREGRAAYKPVSQFAVEELVLAGADAAVVVVDDRKLPVIHYFRDGLEFGLPLSYTWRRERGGTAADLASTYHLARGHTIIVAPPGIMGHGYLSRLLEFHRERGADLTFHAHDQVRLGAGGALSGPLRETLLIGGLVWEAPFTEFLRECVADHLTRNLSEVIANYQKHGKVCGYRTRDTQYAALCGADSWASFCLDSLPTTLIDAEAGDVKAPHVAGAWL